MVVFMDFAATLLEGLDQVAAVLLLLLMLSCIALLVLVLIVLVVHEVSPLFRDYY